MVGHVSGHFGLVVGKSAGQIVGVETKDFEAGKYIGHENIDPILSMSFSSTC